MKYRKTLIWSCMLLLGPAYAQEQAPQKPQPPAETAPKPPAEKPEYSADGVGSVTLYYWNAPTHPAIGTGRGILSGEIPTRFEHAGDNQYTPWVEFAIPAGANTLRLSYFRTQASGNQIAPADLTLNSSSYYQGDNIASAYTLQSAKISLDYISWSFPVDKPKFRLKTLWELQYVTLRSSFDVFNQAAAGSTSSDWLLLPTVGVGIEHMVSKHFRWEAKASGMGIPRRSDLWDAEAYAAFRLGKIEIMAGGRGFHFKTSPVKEQYASATLPGAFVGLRFYPSTAR
jgi:hypothetical protein